MKKSCKGCKASIIERPYYKCELGYDLDKNLGVPVSDCPKPKTNMDFINLKQDREKYGLSQSELAKWKV
ncbi:hypothetical protein G9G63_09280 [Paenibacillus sp. EKM202P]|uniref:hypothetical protein n=1 Tax=unclassified Paenibacillus TaxID=185978 RepID=UPI0013EA700E|nr:MULTISPECIES: hypothetical protein [unclassified Paenibacillus]KAF6565341.1 hypothetical protein G9G63_09280 [Paenibacillus sp. EKM202P]